MATPEAFARIVRCLLQRHRHYPESEASEELLTPQSSIEVREAQENEDSAPTIIQRFMPRVVTSMLSQGGSWLREFVCNLLNNIGGLLRRIRPVNDTPAEAQALLFPRQVNIQYSRYWWDSDDESDSVADLYSHRHHAY